MSTLESTARTSPAPAVRPAAVRRPIAPPALVATALALGTWLVTGAYVDAWAHHHFAFETFFTPWHALLYSGAAANGAFYGTWWLARGRTLPSGYGLALVGSCLFLASGAGDLVWHSLFGVERDFAAILSPTHLGLMVSAGLIATGPLRAAWRSESSALPYAAAWSLALLLALVFFFMQDLHPFTAQWANPSSAAAATLRVSEMLGVDNALLAAAATAGALMVAMTRFRLRPAQVLLITALPAAAVVLTYKPDLVILVAVLAGIFGEALAVLLRPAGRRPGHLRLFAVLFTVFTWGLYMWGLAGSDGVWWPIHSEFGLVAVAALGAWLLSYVALPPARTLSS